MNRGSFNPQIHRRPPAHVIAAIEARNLEATGECERCNRIGILGPHIPLCRSCRNEDLGGEYVTVLAAYEPPVRILGLENLTWGACGHESDDDLCPRCELADA